jgi:hypothetical protein
VLTRLDDVATLRRRAHAPLIAAAALSAAVLSPLVCELFLGQLAFGQRMRMRDLVLGGGWAASLGLALAALAVRAALRAPAAEHGQPGPIMRAVIGRAVAGGVAYPPLLFAPFLLMGALESDLANAVKLALVAPLVLTALGAIVSAPTGAGFGLIFSSGILRSATRLGAPAHDLVAFTRASGAVTLLIASCLAVALAAILEGSYCQTLFFTVLPALGVTVPEGTDAAWTRLVVLPAPLWLGAAALYLLSLREQRRVEATVAALRASAHPAWLLDDATPGEHEASTALPLRETDRGASAHAAVRARPDGAPYREGGAALAVVARAPAPTAPTPPPP